MSNILMIVGLPGSGKSFLSKRINKDNNNNYHIIDDPKNFEKDIAPYLNEDLIITDPYLCFENFRKLAIKKIHSINPDIKIDWIFFKNDPDKCLENSKNRAGKKVESFIKKFSNEYKIPEGSTIVDVY